MIVHENRVDPWKITLVDTEKTMTGGRLKRVLPHIKDEENFFFTYGDVADIDIKKLLEFHKSHGKLATLTATYPPGRFGALKIEITVTSFEENQRVMGL